MAPEDFSFIHFLYTYRIPFAFGWRTNCYKDTFALFITHFIFFNIYVTYFYPCETQNAYTYKKALTYHAVVKQLNRYKVFEIVAPYSYVDDLCAYIKENREKNTPIFLVKNETIQSLSHFKPNLMYTLLYCK